MKNNDINLIVVQLWATSSRCLVINMVFPLKFEKKLLYLFKLRAKKINFAPDFKNNV